MQSAHICQRTRGKFRAGEPANLLAATAQASAHDFFQAAPAPDFFSQAALALAPAPCIFFERLRLQGAKKPALAPDYWLSLTKYSFPRKLVR